MIKTITAGITVDAPAEKVNPWIYQWGSTKSGSPSRNDSSGGSGICPSTPPGYRRDGGKADEQQRVAQLKIDALTRKYEALK